MLTEFLHLNLQVEEVGANYFLNLIGDRAKAGLQVPLTTCSKQFLLQSHRLGP